MAINSINPIIEELESLFSSFNEHYYNNELPKPVITVSPDDSRRGGVLGWFTVNKLWRGTDSEVAHHEINICSNYLDGTPEEMAETLLHEMVHLYCSEHGIQDTCQNGVYHNKKFKYAAEKHGLVVRHKTGEDFSQTYLSDEAKKYISTLPINISLYRLGKPRSVAPKRQSTRRLVCPKCKTIVRVTKPNVHIICGDCQVPFK